MKNIVNQLHQEIAEAMKEIAEKHGLIYVPGTLRYSTNDAAIQVKFVNASTGADDQVPENFVKMGFAAVGSTIKVPVGAGRFEDCVVLKAARSKYTVRRPGGGTGTIQFSACSKA